MEKQKLVYLLSPVRKVTEDQARVISEHAGALRSEGSRIFNPVVDAPQTDPTGYHIVMAELEFMKRAAKEEGRIDILWNAGGVPSEGSRVDLGTALALDLEFNLVKIFNEESPSGPQLGLQLIREMEQMDLENSQLLLSMYFELGEMKSSNMAVIDWDVDMTTDEAEWQRLRLGLALGCFIQDSGFRIVMGKLTGIDPAEKKSYPKVIREIEKRQG